MGARSLGWTLTVRANAAVRPAKRSRSSASPPTPSPALKLRCRIKKGYLQRSSASFLAQCSSRTIICYQNITSRMAPPPGNLTLRRAACYLSLPCDPHSGSIRLCEPQPSPTPPSCLARTEHFHTAYPLLGCDTRRRCLSHSPTSVPTSTPR